MTFERCYHIVAYAWMLEGCAHQDLLWDHLFQSLNAHFTVWIWVITWISLMMPKHFIFTIWFDKLRGIHIEIHRAYNDELFTAKHEMHVGMTWQFHDYGWLHILEWCFQPKASSWLINKSWWFGMMHTINQRIILRRSQERKSFMMNQAAPHLGVGSSLMSDASSNCQRQPGMGTAFTAK